MNEALEKSLSSRYIEDASKEDMALNRLCNRCTGRGFEAATSTFQRCVRLTLGMGGEMGSTGIERQKLFPAWYHRYRAKIVVANDNYAEARLAA